MAAAATAAARVRPLDPGVLPFGELEAAARFGLAVFLALHDAAVAGQEAAMLQEGAQPRLVKGERPADAVPDRTGLARKAAAGHRAPHVELAEPVGDDKRLADQHAQNGPGEIDRAVPPIDLDIAVAGFDPDAGDGVLALAGRVGAAERVALRLDVGRDRLHRGGWSRRRCGRSRRCDRLAQAGEALESLRPALRPRSLCATVRLLLFR